MPAKKLTTKQIEESEDEKMQKLRATFRCHDCKANTTDYYMLKDEVWAQAIAKNKRIRMLCLKHAEKRLGRKLTPEDFTYGPIVLDKGMFE